MSERESRRGRPALEGGLVRRVQVCLQARHLEILREYGARGWGTVSRALRAALDDLARRRAEETEK